MSSWWWRCLSALSALSHLVWCVLGPATFTSVLIRLCFTPYWWIPLTYSAWVLWDAAIQRTGTCRERRVHWIRRWLPMRLLRDYFPVSLVKTCDLDPNYNYVIGYHPHGVVSYGFVNNFGSDTTGFDIKYPGITPYPVTLTVNLLWPVVREYGLALGMISAGRRSIERVISGVGRGHAAVIVVGGSREALLARPGSFNIVLKRRKGFVRLAIQNGAHLVPSFSFGENDAFGQVWNPAGSRFRAFQEWVMHHTTFSPVCFYGRPLACLPFSWIPFQRPITTVVGSPILIERTPEPPEQLVDRIHARYMRALSQLFERHKATYGIPLDVHLNFV